MFLCVVHEWLTPLHLAWAHLPSTGTSYFFHFHLPLFPPLCSLSGTNPACAGLDNKLSGEKRLKEMKGVGSLRCTEPNVHTGM